MPTTVKHFDKKSGKTCVYESTPHYDPLTGQSRPKRKYLGTLDPETGDLISSSGRGGRTVFRSRYHRISKRSFRIAGDYRFLHYYFRS